MQVSNRPRIAYKHSKSAHMSCNDAYMTTICLCFNCVFGNMKYTIRCDENK